MIGEREQSSPVRIEEGDLLLPSEQGEVNQNRAIQAVWLHFLLCVDMWRCSGYRCDWLNRIVRMLDADVNAEIVPKNTRVSVIEEARNVFLEVHGVGEIVCYGHKNELDKLRRLVCGALCTQRGGRRKQFDHFLADDRHWYFPYQSDKGCQLRTLLNDVSCWNSNPQCAELGNLCRRVRSIQAIDKELQEQFEECARNFLKVAHQVAVQPGMPFLEWNRKFVMSEVPLTGTCEHINPSGEVHYSLNELYLVLRKICFVEAWRHAFSHNQSTPQLKDGYESLYPLENDSDDSQSTDCCCIVQ